MDVNEHERPSNITETHKVNIKEQRFYCFSTFHSHSRVFNNEKNLHLKMSEMVQILSINVTSGHVHCSNLFWCIEIYFPVKFKSLSHRKPCNIKKNVTKLISVRKKSYTFPKYFMSKMV